MSFQADENDIGNFLEEKFGTVSRVNLLKNDDGRSKGLAFITFETEEACNKALAASGIELMGRSVKIEKTQPKGDRPAPGPGQSQGSTPVDENSTTIFVGNLPFTCDSDSLREFFSSCGTVNDTRIA